MIDVFGDRFREGEPLSRRCSLRVGGPAKFWVEVHTDDELTRVAEFAAGQGVPIYVVGLGSNTLFPDAGVDGVVVRLGGKLAEWSVEEDIDEARVEVGGGVVNAHLVRGLLRSGWVGAEFLSLIPGTFGGAVAMNAGTREKELSEIIERVDIVTPGEPGKVHTMAAAELEMTYRHCALPKGGIVTRGSIRVVRGDVELASGRVRTDKERRNQTQPYRLASVGSTFANPPGDYAGRLIEAAGLKGHQVGGAKVSDLHANFFINENDATADDFIALMAKARHEVRQKFGVELRPEVQFVGFDGWARLVEIERDLASGEHDA